MGDEAPRGPTLVHRAVARFARARPDAVAAWLGDERLTYADLDRRSDRLAALLRARGVGPEVHVAVALGPSFSLLVALIAIFKAGGVYMPLDPGHPAALRERMLDDAAPAVLLIDVRTPSDVRGRGRCLAVDDVSDPVEARAEVAPSLADDLDCAATLFYTSGTTGEPKGVTGTHRNLAHHLDRARERYRFDADDVFSAVARTTFSISLFELLSPLACGGSVRLLSRDQVLSPDRLACILDEVTVVHAGPSLLASLFRHLAREQPLRTFPRVRHASTGGDLAPAGTLEEMTRRFENAEVFVIYGCTELSCMATTVEIAAGEAPARARVGKPFRGVTVRLLDDERREVPLGAVGEIHVGGEGCVRGYHRRQSLTAERFFERGGVRFYATGDLGRADDDGNLELVGRRDFQVKIRGVRVELPGVEHAIRELSLAEECAVVATREGDGETELVAYLVEPRPAEGSAFRSALAALLPEASIPRHVVTLEALPLTFNGKIDRRKLQDGFARPATAPSRERSRDGATTESAIVDVLSRVLGIAVGLDDDFFALGGHSLLAVVATRDLELALGRSLPPLALFEAPTPRGLARHLGRPATPSRMPIALNETTAGTPLFVLAGAAGYRRLAARLAGVCPVLALVSEREAGVHPDDQRSVRALASEHVAILRRAGARGPHRLLGYSFAGIVAYEVAQQLGAAGEEVELLVMVDSQLPEWSAGWSSRLRQLARVARVPPRRLASFALRELRTARARWRAGAAGAGDAVTELARRREVVNVRAAGDYARTLPLFSGETLLFTSTSRIDANPANTPDCGWAAHVPRLTMITAHAGHAELLEDEAHLGRVAEVLRARLVELERLR